MAAWRRATEAQALLEQLAGPHATLRDDQWTADRGAGRAPASGAGRAAHRVGQVGGVLHRREAAARAGHGPTVIVSPLLALMRNQVAAAERAGVRAATINSSNVTDWDDIHAPGRRRRPRRAAGQPGTAEQSRLPRPGAARAGRATPAWWSSTRRTACRTGATTSGPTTAGSAR